MYTNGIFAFLGPSSLPEGNYHPSSMLIEEEPTYCIGHGFEAQKSSFLKAL